MELQNPLKHSLSKMFRSCKRSDVSDVLVECPRQHYQLIELFSPKPHHPVFPVASFDTWHEFERHRPESKGKERRSSKKGRKRITRKDKPTWPKIITNNNYYDWSTSDDEVDTDNNDKNTLFSSSDSSDSFHQPRNKLAKSKANDLSAENDGFAVVKRSSDPYSDFRSSMVEMIVENQIFGAMELEWLLETFLSLNSNNHHMVIIKVFMEIWEALFSDLSY